MPHSIQYNPTLAQQHVTPDALLPFPLFGITGGYGRTRAALVDAVRNGNHVVARGLFTKLVLEGIGDDCKELGIPVEEAHLGLVEACKRDPMHSGFLVEAI